MSKNNYKVFFDINIGINGSGRIIFELFTDLTPKTAENFRGLTTGQYGKVGNHKLHYLNTKFHGIVDQSIIVGGDITIGNGTGGYSIYGKTFVDQNFARRHSCAGLLSTYSTTRDTNNSQFFITLKACPQFDDKHVVFGQVIHGMEIVRKISKVPIDMKDRPKIPILIVDCGQIDDFKSFLKYDPFKKDVFDEIEQHKKKLQYQHRRLKELLKEGFDNINDDLYNKNKLQECQKELQLLNIQKSKYKKIPTIQEEEKQLLIENKQWVDGLSQNLKRKYFNMNLQINQSKALNSKAVIQQQLQLTDPNYIKQQKKKIYFQKKKHQKEHLNKLKIDDKEYLNTPSFKQTGKKKQIYQPCFGWEVYNEDSKFKAYHKRLKNLNYDPNIAKKLKQDPNYEPSRNEQVRQKVAQLQQQQDQKRKHFSRKRMINEDQPVNAVNRRNYFFNKKLQRFFGNYAADIKTNLQVSSHKL